MIRTTTLAATALLCLASILPAAAQDVLIRRAKVHTATDRGTLADADVLVQGGVIRGVGPGLAAPAGIEVVEAGGRPLTPGLFAGLTALGLEEISGERDTVDHAIDFSQVATVDAQWRPEFDPVPAYNPRSAAIAVNRVEGLTFTMLAPGSMGGGSFVTGQGEAVRLDGRFDATLDGSRTLFVDLGGGAVRQAGGSRAALYMLLEQAIAEAARTGTALTLADAGRGLLTPAGRETFARYLDGGRVVFYVDRAADIVQALKLAERHGFEPIIAGGAEAWEVADLLATRGVPVLVDALANLPSDFEHLGARLDNAARLHAAGVPVGFTQSGDATHNARKIRQLAGVAAANGLPWEAALAGITSVPAQAFGVGDRVGRIAVGQRADLVLWSGDPLEVTTGADQVWIAGRPDPMRSRQTELRDRYLGETGGWPRGYVK
ncbi:amidohydrolase family protein [Coralloluteibacterium stylophorae]|uniref:Amidohydrolase family protein n=1 Tax=Coralloluteibacterium stylophorae TaxID=1776034 RepID=A0A8J7VUR2_9GAMM|nr:amidohydrolase family protein [Coralloluteibacterium stylophorae]MBS7458019.1 amidohydrolase family protein [Coralloluteibacterium stylophorae]